MLFLAGQLPNGSAALDAFLPGAAAASVLAVRSVLVLVPAWAAALDVADFAGRFEGAASE